MSVPTKSRWERVISATVVLGVAVLILVFGDEVVDDDTAVASGLVVAVIAAGLFGSAWRGLPSGLAAVGVALVLLAIYLPEIGADAAIAEWFGEDAGDADRLDLLALARWVLVIVGAGLLLWPGRKVVLEAALTAVVLIAVIAAVGAIFELSTRASTADADQPGDPDVTRSFALPADKVESVTGDLEADGCVDVVLVRAIDADTADEANALTYVESTYAEARLPAELAEGDPTSAVTVELAEESSPAEFATDLTAASAAYILGCPP